MEREGIGDSIHTDWRYMQFVMKTDPDAFLQLKQ